MRSILSAFGFLFLGVGRFAQTRAAAVLVWVVFWAMLVAAAQLSLSYAFWAWMLGYGASRLVWGRWRRSFAKGMVAVAITGTQVVPYWQLIIQ